MRDDGFQTKCIDNLIGQLVYNHNEASVGNSLSLLCVWATVDFFMSVFSLSSPNCII